MHKLPPAHTLLLTVTTDGFNQRLERYWQLDYFPKHKLSALEAHTALRDIL